MTVANSKTFYTGCALCYHSCGAEVTVENGRVVEVRGQKSHPLNKGKLCPKGEMLTEHLYHPERLKYPLKKVGGKWERTTWEQALSEIAAKLNDLKERYGPSVIAFFCGSIGVESLEMVSLTHRFRTALGSPQFFSVESICYRMRIRSRQITFGKYPVEEMDSPLYVLWGHNPAASDFPLSLAIEENLKKGSRVIVIDPRRIPIADKAIMYMPIRPGTDGALALALINVIINERLYDADFVEKWTYGFDKLVPHIQQYTPEWAERITWVRADDIRTLARLFASTKGASIYQGTCTQDQSANGSQTDRAIAILQSITGNINVPGGWVISPRLRLADISLPCEEKPLGADEYPLFYELWGRKSPYAVQNMVPESIPDKLKAFIVVGGNPLVTMPDSNALREAYRKLNLLVVYDLFMTETAQEAHYVLPAATQLEYCSLAYNYNVCHCLPYIMLREPAIEPLYESKSILAFYTELAHACGIGDKFHWKSDEELVAHLIAPSGVDFEALRQNREGVYYGEKSYRITERTFATPTGRIEIYSKAFKDAGFDPLPTYLEPTKSPQGPLWNELGKKYPLILSTGTRLLHYNNSQLHNIKALQLEEPYPKAELGPETAAKYGVAHGDDVIIETDRGWIKMKAHVDERIMEGVVLVPHGWPGEANCNRLTDAQCREPVMGYPQFKGLLCNIRKAGAPHPACI
ncbi:MAG: molybdopterin-dependent oxidoreductase [Armatimonadetes bacterium]|nr:molybdopterin-dependent oxidoreductase [Armatimonadota bacterium]